MPEHCINLGLIGWPLEHSMSPQIHQAALHKLGICGNYRLFAIEPNNIMDIALSDLFQHVVSGELTGLNVTLPHKQNVLPFLSDLTPAAAHIGAVNTIFLEDGLLKGDNTDVAGFLNDLEHLPFAEHAPSLILGAGGAARAVLFSLLGAGHPVSIAARNPTKARTLANSFNSIAKTPIQVLPLEAHALAQICNSIGLVVNATPLGMSPNIETCPWPENLPLPAHASIYDLVYNPADTLLVRRARQSGRPACSGLGMLVEQAALAFERWTGLAAPRETMKQAAQQASKLSMNASSKG